jgi:hypothetical protein
MNENQTSQRIDIKLYQAPTGGEYVFMSENVGEGTESTESFILERIKYLMNSLLPTPTGLRKQVCQLIH